jgi:hypothetical protein
MEVFPAGFRGGIADYFGNPEASFTIQDLPQKEAEGIPLEEAIELFFFLLGKRGWEQKMVDRVLPVRV